MGFEDVTKPRSAKKFNLAFKLIPGIVMKGNYTPLEYYLTSAGYIRRQNAQSPMDFLDKSRLEKRVDRDGKEHILKTGSAKLAFLTIEDWNEALKFFAERIKRDSNRLAKQEGSEILWYPGPEHRGQLLGARIGIM